MTERRLLLERWLEGVVNGRDLSLVDELLAADYVGRTPAQPEPMIGADGHREVIARIHAGFSDLEGRLEDSFAAGDREAIRFTVRGTHDGEYQGIPPTGTRIEMPQIIIARIADGRIAESWQQVDALGLMQQLGVVPPRGTTSPGGLLAWVFRTIVRFARLQLRAGRRRA